VGDAELLLELAEAVRSDRAAPVLEQTFDPTDPVAIEILLHEADFMVEGYMEKWRPFRDRFSDPSVYDAFVLDYQMRVRSDLKAIVSEAQQFIADATEYGDNEEEDEGQDETDA
jgi:hypothetical protein